MLLSSLLLLLTGFVSLPLQVDKSSSLEAEAAAKEVLEERVLHNGDSIICFDIDPHGARAKGHPSDPDYAVYGHKSVYFDLHGSSIEPYNRLVFDITPDCPGLHVINLTVGFENREATGEGFNEPAGEHLIHLDNGHENHCYFEMADLRRDNMKGLRFTVTLKGLETAVKDECKIHINRIAAQRVPATERVSGWAPQSNQIVYSMSGYLSNSPKTALINVDRLSSNPAFVLTDARTGNKVFEGTVRKQSTTTGEYGVMDFSTFTTPGTYVLTAGGLSTEPFAIGDDRLWDSANEKVLSFIYGQRCGYPVHGVHSMCHADVFSVHNGMKRSYAGGWHDAGDLSQQTLQTADVVYALLEMYNKEKDRNPVFASRLREEALWGLDFVLRCRFGDGYHASSMGLLIWTDGVVGSHDDIHTVRIQNIAYDNYLYAAYEAYAARILNDDSAMSAYLTQIAQEDFDFACEKFAESGFGGWITPYEHTYCTSESQHMATASWAASMLYETTGDHRYGDAAADYAHYVLDSQCDKPVGNKKISGFFYRNPQKRSVVHTIHQSREQLYMLAMTALCRTQPEHADYAKWYKSVHDYGEYLKAMMAYTAPYGMLPSGIYHEEEPTDTDAFFAVHLFPPSDATERFRAQQQHGEDVGDGYFVKRFPVWFNIFNGNLAVHTSLGKAAALCAKCLNDKTLSDISVEQLYWIVGKNPFAQSLIYGEGHRYPELNNFSSGLTMGAMPVGIRSLGDTDEPYWPQINTACYKEVWVTSAGKWLSLMAETDDAAFNHENYLISQNIIK